MSATRTETPGPSAASCPAPARVLGVSSLRRHARRAGVGLAELLVALAICASLLTAVAVALDASINSYKINQEQSALTQRARLAAHRILTAIRQAEAHSPITTALVNNFTAGARVTDIGVAMIDSAGNDVTYRYDSVNRRLIQRAGGVDRVLVQGVSAFSVTLEPMRSPDSVRTGGGFDLLYRATILLTVCNDSNTTRASETTGSQTISISSSVMPRRNVW